MNYIVKKLRIPKPKSVIGKKVYDMFDVGIDAVVAGLYITGCNFSKKQS